MMQEINLKEYNAEFNTLILKFYFKFIKKFCFSQYQYQYRLIKLYQPTTIKSRQTTTGKKRYILYIEIFQISFKYCSSNYKLTITNVLVVCVSIKNQVIKIVYL